MVVAVLQIALPLVEKSVDGLFDQALHADTAPPRLVFIAAEEFLAQIHRR